MRYLDAGLAAAALATIGAAEAAPVLYLPGSGANGQGATALGAMAILCPASASNGATLTVCSFGGGGGGNAAASTTGAAVPSAADYLGISVNGTLVGVSSANPMPVAGTLSISGTPSVSVAGPVSLAGGSVVSVSGTSSVAGTVSIGGTTTVAGTLTTSPKTGTFVYAGCTVGTSSAQCLASGLVVNHVTVENVSANTIACAWAGGTATIGGANSFVLTPYQTASWGPVTSGVPTGNLNCTASAASSVLYLEYN